MSKTFLQLARLGDLINCLPIFHAEAQATGQPSRVMCCKQYASLFGGTSYVTCIPFDGLDSELKRAHETAAAQGGEVVSLQVIGSTDDVLNYTYGPAGFDKAQTDSFQKEPYWLSKNKPLWAQQVRPVFDGRSAAREKKLFPSWYEPGKDKLILVAADGNSSPFPFKDILFELLDGRFKSEFTVIDLGSLKAERFYDFLGMLEQAHCLVSIDSAFLHLAHAVPSLPVAALVNDKPQLWNGSAWRANHIAHVRYSEFPKRGIELLNAIDGLKASTCYPIAKNFLKSPRLIHVWSQYEVPTEEARGTWLKEYDEANWIECAVPVGAFGRDSASHPKVKDTARFPYLGDVIRCACFRANDDDIIVLTKANACFSDNLSADLLSGSLPAFSHRYVRENRQDTWHPAVDLFAFTKKWWIEHQLEVPDFFLAHDMFWNRTLRGLIIENGAREIRGSFRAPSTARVPSETFWYNEYYYKLFEEKHDLSIAKACAEQLPCAIINRHALEPFAYNASIASRNGRMLAACRYHDQRDSSTALGIAEIDEKGVVYGRKPIQLPHVGGSEEDPRFFTFGGDLWLSYVDSTYPAMPPKAAVKYGKLVEDTAWSIPQIFQPNYGRNDLTGCEKNWLFFEWNTHLIAVYAFSGYGSGDADRMIVLQVKGEATQKIAENDSPKWLWGPIRGGTTPIPYKGTLLTFFQSSSDADIPPYKRRYFIGALTMQNEPPFKVLSVSKKPILWGAELDSLTVMERSACHHYKPKCVLPFGALSAGPGTFLVSAGINDSHCGLFTVTERDLHL